MAEADSTSMNRGLSHAEYLETLHRPSEAEVRRISQIQCQREREISQKYHTHEAQEAAIKIQNAYRSHRTRRHLDGYILDPSARWDDVIRELRYRAAISPLEGPGSARVGSDGRPRAPSDVAKRNWQRIATIAERAGAGETSPRNSVDSLDHSSTLDHQQSMSMLLDMRYFLEMVDEKHRYGTNLMVYHGEWLKSTTNQNFFYWLDRGEGRHLSMPGCSREKLDKERIRYLSREERKGYLVCIDDQGKLRWEKNGELITTSNEEFRDSISGIISRSDVVTPTFQDESITRQLSESRNFLQRFTDQSSMSPIPLADIGEASSSEGEDAKHEVEEAEAAGMKQTKREKMRKRLHVSPATILNNLMRATIKPGTWIYVADTVGRLYVGIKASGAFQHASFLSGARISSAGQIGITNGQLVYLSPLSGHYRPTAKSFKLFINSLQRQGVDLSHLRISRAFRALVSLEYYTRKRQSLHNAVHHHHHHHHHQRHEGKADDEDQHRARLDQHIEQERNEHPIEMGEQHVEREHKKGLPKLIDDLHLRKRSLSLRRKKDGT